jgi:hypothetical protein
VALALLGRRAACRRALLASLASQPAGLAWPGLLHSHQRRRLTRRPRPRACSCACTAAVVFLGEAAQAMVQNADYEIPYLRKQLAKYNQQVLDADRKQAE